jgi:signal transduction histidine kinase
MRRRAEDVSSERTGQRLPLPAAYDEIRRLGETLNAMLARLEAGLERERRFVADASHELRTPLALLRAELELALRRPRTADELGEALRSAAAEVERLTRLAEDLLVLARLGEGGLPLRREPLSAAELLETVARRFARRADEAGRSLEVEAGRDVRFSGDRLRLEQALGNLVDNALTHGAGTVHLVAARRDGFVELRVDDEGGGFPPEFVHRAFDRFSRSDEVRSGGSTGLGLAIVDAIARAHGGSATASDDGNGSVAIRLPTGP